MTTMVQLSEYEDGDRWKLLMDANGDLWLSGSDIDWEERPALNHGLVLDPSERTWLADTLAIVDAVRLAMSGLGS